MRRAVAMVLVSLAAFAAPVDDASAARVLRTDFAGLVGQSAMIVEGRVLSVDVNAGQLEPRTRITLLVERHFDGEHPGSHLTFDLPMGVMPDGSMLDIAEAPRFAPGESYLVFYKAGDWRITPVVGWDQGYFRAVERDGDTWFVDAGGHCVTDLGAMGFAIGRRIAPPASMPGFGEPVAAGPEDHAPSTAPCMPAETVRATLRSRLTAAPVTPTHAWRATPVGSILRTPMQPHVGRAAAAPACGPWTSCPGQARP